MRFSNWSRFEDRTTINNIGFPGVYVIAKSTTNIAGRQFDWHKKIVYVGMTVAAGGIRARLNAFDRTLRGKGGHGGAERFRYAKDIDPRKLYVAIWSVKCSTPSTLPADLRMMGAVVQGEYLALARYAERFGMLPKYNDKKGAPKHD